MIEKVESEILDVSALSSPGYNPKTLKIALTNIFARVLRRSRVDEDDDFFDLGGDSLLAVTLMAEIHKITGQQLPITSLYEAPNIRALARLLAEGTLQPESCFTLLKSGGKDLPLFIVHGLGGSVMELRALAKCIDIKQMIYGIEARGLDGRAEPFDRIENMARFHVDEVTRMQPEGPYFLAGYSFGGLVALEMARILVDAGKRVALLALIDTYPHAKFWPLTCRLMGLRKLIRIQASKTFWSRLTRHYASVLRDMPFHKAVAFLLNKAGRAAQIPFDVFRLGALLHRFMDAEEIESLAAAPADMVLPIHLQRVIDAGDVAFVSYRPKFYAGEIIFIKAEDAIRVPFNASQLWGKICKKLSIHNLPGNHRSLIKDNPQALADLLSVCVKTASSTATTV